MSLVFKSIKVGVATVGLAAAAFAGPAATDAFAADVPTCVTATYSNPAGPYQDVTVYNGCPATVRVKVLWAHATNSRCYSIAPRTSVRDHHLNQNIIDAYDGIVSC